MMQSNGDPNTVLLLQNGFGHGSLSHSSECTKSYIKDYVLEGKLPIEGTNCDSEAPIFTLEKDEDSAVAKVIKSIINFSMSIDSAKK